MSEVPEESCNISPSKVCKSIAQLVPHLTPVEKCSDLPREICSFGLKSPKITEKPLITKWCFDPADEDQLEANNDLGDYDLPSPPEFEDRELPDPPELIPIEVEDVLIFEDGDDEGVDSGLRNGKKLGISNEAPSVKNQFDPSSSLKTKLPFPERIKGEDFRAKDAQKFVEKTDQNDPDNLYEKTRQEDDGSAAIINEIESINREDEAEGRNVNKQFKAILSQLNSDFRSKIKIEKADIDNDRKKAAALAKIIKHKNSSVSHTILIKNTPEAHKIFGIKNAPAFKEEELLHTTGEEHHEPNTNEILDFEPIEENTPDLAFSDETEVEPGIVTSQSIANQPILGLGELKSSNQAESTAPPPVANTATNFPQEDITGTN